MKRPVVAFAFHQISLLDKQTDWDKRQEKLNVCFIDM